VHIDVDNNSLSALCCAVMMARAIFDLADEIGYNLSVLDFGGDCIARQSSGVCFEEVRAPFCLSGNECACEVRVQLVFRIHFLLCTFTHQAYITVSLNSTSHVYFSILKEQRQANLIIKLFLFITEMKCASYFNLN